MNKFESVSEEVQEKVWKNQENRFYVYLKLKYKWILISDNHSRDILKNCSGKGKVPKFNTGMKIIENEKRRGLLNEKFKTQKFFSVWFFRLN